MDIPGYTSTVAPPKNYSSRANLGLKKEKRAKIARFLVINLQNQRICA